jgi:hypothetical protein
MSVNGGTGLASNGTENYFIFLFRFVGKKNNANSSLSAKGIFKLRLAIYYFGVSSINPNFPAMVATASKIHQIGTKYTYRRGFERCFSA